MGESPESQPLQKQIQDWVVEARSVLMQLGMHVKSTIGIAQKLVSAAGRSRDAVKTLQTTAESLLTTVQQTETLLQGEAPDLMVLRTLVEEIKLYSEKSKIEAEAAHSTLDEVFQSASEIDGHITHTTETMMQEARMMQDLKGKASG